MKINDLLKKQILEIADNQIQNNDPPEAKLAYERLIKTGNTDFDVKQMIGQCLAVELFDILKMGKSFDSKRYIKNLARLPKEPFD